MLDCGTSISHEENYISICREAAKNKIVFEVFRRHPTYMGIVEGLSAIDGAEYIKYALNVCPEFLGLMSEFQRNDSVGGPIVSQYSPIGPFSPTTLRYIKVAADIETMFGSLDGLRVAEIGVGYGGQCRILSCRHDFASYALYDLPEAASLATRYLNCFSVKNVISRNIFEESDQEYDFVISNYALSEIRKDVQDVYIERLLKRAKHGYIIYNQAFFEGTYPGFSYSVDDVLRMFPNFKCKSGHPDMPEADVRLNNFLLYW